MRDGIHADDALVLVVHLLETLHGGGSGWSSEKPGAAARATIGEATVVEAGPATGPHNPFPSHPRL